MGTFCSSQICCTSNMIKVFFVMRFGCGGIHQPIRLFVLLILSSAAAGNPECPRDTQPNCLHCDSDSHCLQCKPGFALQKDATCIQCHPGCEVCTIDQVCLKCFSGFTEGDMKCSKCSSNCKSCNRRADECSSCYFMYDLDSAAARCDLEKKKVYAFVAGAGLFFSLFVLLYCCLRKKPVKDKEQILDEALVAEVENEGQLIPGRSLKYKGNFQSISEVNRENRESAGLSESMEHLIQTVSREPTRISVTK